MGVKNVDLTFPEIWEEFQANLVAPRDILLAAVCVEPVIEHKGKSLDLRTRTPHIATGVQESHPYNTEANAAWSAPTTRHSIDCYESEIFSSLLPRGVNYQP